MVTSLVLRPATGITSGRECLLRIEDELSALPEKKVRTPQAKAQDVVGKVVAIWRNVHFLRPELANLPGFDLARFDRLPVYAHASLTASTELVILLRKDPDLIPTVEIGQRMRRNLLADLRAASQRGLIHESVLRSIERPSGYLKLATDLGALASVARTHWRRLEGKTGITEDEMSEAELLCAKITDMVGRSRHDKRHIERVRDRYHRAFTLMSDGYDELRAGVQYLRRNEGDADRHVPPLVQRKRARKKAGTPMAPVNPGSAP